jgi:hypothetical protein
MEVLVITFNQTLPNYFSIPFPNPAGGHLSWSFWVAVLIRHQLRYLLPDYLFFKIPNFGMLQFLIYPNLLWQHQNSAKNYFRSRAALLCLTSVFEKKKTGEVIMENSCWSTNKKNIR